MKPIAILVAGVAVIAIAGGSAHAAEVEVLMLNKGSEGPMVFEPALVKIALGDTVKFIAKDKGHDVDAILTMLPDGAAPFKGKISQDVTVTFDKPGVYGYRCVPHYGMGMVGLIVVGDPVNEDKAKAVIHPGKAKQTFANLFSKLDQSKSAAK